MKGRQKIKNWTTLECIDSTPGNISEETQKH